MAGRSTIVGKHALLLTATGKVEVASQIFVYDHIREIRLDMDKLEIKLLMDYDEAYFIVHRIILKKDANEKEKEDAKRNILDFYDKLLRASMKFTPEELEFLLKKRSKRISDIEKNKIAFENKKNTTKTHK